MGDEVEASNDPPVPSNDCLNFENDSNEVEDNFVKEIISVFGVDELETRDGDEHNDGDKNIVNVDGDDDGITGDGTTTRDTLNIFISLPIDFMFLSVMNIGKGRIIVIITRKGCMIQTRTI